jgi:hypothetical protein
VRCAHNSQLLDILEWFVLLAVTVSVPEASRAMLRADAEGQFGGSFRGQESAAVPRGPEFLGDSAPVHCSLRLALLSDARGHRFESVGELTSDARNGTTELIRSCGWSWRNQRPFLKHGS